jgi:hypothetical protein
LRAEAPVGWLLLSTVREYEGESACGIQRSPDRYTPEVRAFSVVSRSGERGNIGRRCG